MSLALLDCAVIDVVDGSVTRHVDVRILDGRIVAITPHTTADADPRDATHIDAQGAYLVPGLVDMHAHVLDQPDPRHDLQLMLTNGVTGFRQMSGSAALLATRRAGTGAVSLLPGDEPTCLAMPGEVLTPANAGTPDAVVETIRRQHSDGADFIKAALVEPDVFPVAQAEATRLGLPIVGHLPNAMDVRVASRGGMRSIEHLGPGLGILAACSTEEDAIQTGLARSPRLPMPPSWLPWTGLLMGVLLRRVITNPFLMWRPDAVALLQRAVDSFDEDKARRLAAQLVADGTWQGATLIRQNACVCGDSPRFRANPDLRYVATSDRRRWDKAGGRFDRLPEATKDAFRAMYDLQLRITHLFDAEGVRILAGSDCGGGTWEVPGFALHEELGELVRAGLTPLRALQAATSNAAEFLGRTGELGRVATGHRADLVLLQENPLDDISRLSGVSGIVRNGHWYSRADLDTIRSGLEG